MNDILKSSSCMRLSHSEMSLHKTFMMLKVFWEILCGNPELSVFPRVRQTIFLTTSLLRDRLFERHISSPAY